jgi:hypothetical protein
MPMTRYTAIIALVFATERTCKNKYDLWDVHIPVEVRGPKAAVPEALSRLKKFEELWAIPIDL